MAIVFSLEICFLNNTYNRETIVRHFSKRLMPKGNVSFHPVKETFVSANGPNPSQLSVIPKNIGIAVSYDTDGEELKLSRDEAEYLVKTLYYSLKSLPSYQIAAVGWEIYDLGPLLKNPQELEDFEGIVVANTLLENLNINENKWEEFDSSHKWIPYKSIDNFQLISTSENR